MSRAFGIRPDAQHPLGGLAPERTGRAGDPPPSAPFGEPHSVGRPPTSSSSRRRSTSTKTAGSPPRSGWWAGSVRVCGGGAAYRENGRRCTSARGSFLVPGRVRDRFLACVDIRNVNVDRATLDQRRQRRGPASRASAPRRPVRARPTAVPGLHRRGYRRHGAPAGTWPRTWYRPGATRRRQHPRAWPPPPPRRRGSLGRHAREPVTRPGVRVPLVRRRRWAGGCRSPRHSLPSPPGPSFPRPPR